MPSSSEFRRTLAAGKIPAVVLLVGSDEAAKQRVLAALIAALPDSDLPGAVERFQAAPLARVLDACRTVPLLGGRCLVMARDQAELGGAGEASARQELQTYVEAPADHAVLVLVMEKVDGRLAVVKAVQQKAVVVDCEPPGEREMPAWIQARGKELAISMTAAACQALADAVGTETALAEGELQKLRLLPRADGRPLEPSDVEQALGPSRVVGAFALEDALLGGDAAGALEALDRHLGGTDSAAPLALLGRLAAIVRRLSIAAAVVARGGNEQQLRETLGVHPFVAAKYARAAARLGSRCERALVACVGADLALKSGGAPRAALAAIVVALAGTATRPAPSAGRMARGHA